MDRDREDILAGYVRAESRLGDWLARTSPSDLRRPSHGTHRNNEELIFHMVFGYMVVRALLPRVALHGRLHPSCSRAYANALNACTVPFDFINYWGSKAAATIYNRHRMAQKLHRVTAALGRRLEAESVESLAVSVPFPTRWDAFFTSSMTLLQVYAYPTLHFDFHAGQLDIRPVPDRDAQ